jgi:glycosyltransferase involved in cell wall biosynthesis
VRVFSMTSYKVLLGSGLRLDRTPSFLRQFILLSKFFEKRHIQTVIFGPDGVYTGQRHPEAELCAYESFSFFEKLAKVSGARTAILLGYPDQFPFFQRAHKTLPLYLWAQFSRPPVKGALRGVCAVPLTQKTKTFILTSGEKHVARIIPHGVDTEMYRPLDEKTVVSAKKTMGIEDRFVIGSVGAHTPRKRFDSIIQTFARLQRIRKEAMLIIKTDRAISPEGTDLQTLARREGVLDKTLFLTEELSDERMCTLYNVMDIFLNLSEWEGFCLPVIEAMSCGTPVSSMSLQGPGETVPYKELRIPARSTLDVNGSLLFRCDPQEAARIIVDVSRNLSLVEELSRAGRKEAATMFDIRTVAELWDELISGHEN